MRFSVKAFSAVYGTAEPTSRKQPGCSSLLVANRAWTSVNPMAKPTPGGTTNVLADATKLGMRAYLFEVQLVAKS
jgi:hypothetical protein